MPCLTAVGAGDWVTSPVSGDDGPMPGVEFNANLLSAILNNTLVREPAPWVRITLSLFVVALCSLLLPRLRPKQMLATTLALALLPLAITIGALSLAWVYIPLASATIAVIFIYPLWSWRRHEIAWQFIQQELSRIDDESRQWRESGLWVEHEVDIAAVESQLARILDTDVSLAGDATPPLTSDAARSLFEATRTELKQSSIDTRAPPGEILAAQIRKLENRAKNVREGRSMGLAGLGHMANGTLIISALGEVVFANTAAARLLGLTTNPDAADALSLLAPIAPPLGQSWIEIMRDVVLEQTPTAFEAQAPDQNPLYVAAQPLDIGDTRQAHAPFWVLTLSDLSAIRAAEAQREEALAFLSHDIRSPLMSVLALIRSSDERSDLLDAINRYTQKGLSTSEQFLQLSRLQLSSRFERYELETGQLLDNAIEQVYFLARDKKISIQREEPHASTAEPEHGFEEGVWIDGNGELLERAFVNLLGNAIKYSEAGSKVVVTLAVQEGIARSDIIDEGHGIPAEEIDHIFEPYYRSDRPELAENRGAGLGLRFVKTVIERHNGAVEVDSTWGQGTTFTITLPLAADAKQPDRAAADA